MMTTKLRALAHSTLLAALAAAALAEEPRRSASASGERHPLLELFTSEGCSSCPPADAWLNHNGAQLQARGFVPLAFHVDYWNQLGWPDPFSQARFTERQRVMSERDGTQIYTPELALDGHELPRRLLDARLADAPRTAGATLTLEATGRDVWRVVARAAGVTLPVRLSLALYENGLRVAVPRGENAGKTLTHDFVVRALFTVDGTELRREVRLAPAWNARAVGLAAFVEDARTGELLQAVALPPPP